MNQYLEKISDLLMFREGREEDDSGNYQPVVTSGSIVWGILLRSAILIFLSFVIMAVFNFRPYMYLFFFLFWFVAAYPGWRQYQVFQQRVRRISEDTLCGSCRHFEQTGQLCRILDEHVTKSYIPCEGLSWEPGHFDSER